MIEFAEFLKIIKGGGNSKEGQKDDGTGAIYKFFKDLTEGKMGKNQDREVPFCLMVSTHRRRKILESMQELDPSKRKEGERILANYKKQLAEKMAREEAEKGTAAFSRPTSGSRQSKRSKMN
mmetsp:Transcript_12860/g.21752  ORF Transcript_12860/g.21752 Transcript_12860/m.21752 type:complete len:122 (+) Transcript_12860:523-888(+)